MAEFEKGQEVEVTGTEGHTTTGTVVALRHQRAENYEILHDTTLVEYWADYGEKIPPDDTVIGVELPNNNHYDYPESKVEPVRNVEDEESLTHVGHICPECDEAFSKHSDEAVEGDEGETYCSLDCLLTSYG
jgi:hypothetical protein